MKILLASMMPTHPPNVGNRARILQLCAALKSLGHDLHFAYIRREAGVGQWLKRRVLAAFSLDAAFTHRVDDWYDPELDGFFEQLNVSHAFDAVIVEYVFLWRADVVFTIQDRERDTFGGRTYFLERAYANAWVALNLCQAGTGLAIKSIEALGYALPLITTTTGARGYRPRPPNSTRAGTPARSPR